MRPSRERIALAGPHDPRDLPGDFGHRRTIEVRFADTDAMGHVNNAIYLTYVEAARVGYWAVATGEAIERAPDRSESLILAEAEVAFRSPIFHGETVVVESRATRIGRTSLHLEHRLTTARPDGPRRLVAVCRTVVVRYDYRTERPIPFEADIVDRLEDFEGRPLRASA